MSRNHTRRNLLKTLALAPLAKLGLAWSAPTAARGLPQRGELHAPQLSTLHGHNDAWIEIRPDHLRHNAARIHRKVEGRPVLAVIKNDGYGMGLVNSARALEGVDGIAGFGVVKLNEAMTLRDHGIKGPILLMGPAEENELEEALRSDITPMVFRPSGRMLERLARRLDRPVRVEVKVDSGLGRLGVRDENGVDFYRDLAEREGVHIQGSMITFSEDRDHDMEQKRRFEALMGRLKEAGIDHGRLHAASTTPLIRYPEAWYDMVRPGMGLYGVYPQAEQREEAWLDLKPAFAVRCRVIDLRDLKKGQSAGYGRAFVAERDTRIATLPIGHADGWQRRAAGCATVRINDRHYPVVGSVSASHSLVEVGRDSDVGVGDVVTLFDWQEDSRPEKIAYACDISVYDLLMHFSPRLPRYQAT
ncbi:alanine racemase [Wenzhouxiangella sp. AB-CW3]|uniref:alanine racemase n=1 Tax=Wenzhouxiangella sp. AB-CW3 TaxID=2771012 RepID=UPI00168B3E37|nr:alanine racemase [Wenzhouxiangella sp. AB-CW3]QOC24069.1 alanine racemase [Wenzhouxiangella sp. AB-CW3]